MKKRIVFYGGDSQVGTTMAALAAAERLVRKGERVLFISAGTVPGNEYLNQMVTASIDDLRLSVQENLLTAEELRQQLVESRGVDILPGVRSDGSGSRYRKDDILKICEAAEGYYDWILVDGGCGLPEGITEAALHAAGQVVIVVSQQEKCLQRLKLRLPALRQYLPPHIIYAVNKFSRSAALYSEKELAEKLQCSLESMVLLPFIPYGWQAEAERRTLLRYRSFRKGMDRLLKQLERGWEKDEREGDEPADGGAGTEV